MAGRYNTITVTAQFDKDSITDELNDIYNEVLFEIDKIGPQIRQILTDQVINRDNWNPQAVYSPKAPIQGGTPYDLSLSGQLLTNIANPANNPISRGDGTINIGIGNIKVLDSLRSRRTEYGDYGGNNDFPYWRSVVFGRSAPRGDFTFVYTSDGANGKDTGFIVPGKPKFRGTPPTYMFQNGLKVALPAINKEIDNAISQALKAVRSKW